MVRKIKLLQLILLSLIMLVSGKYAFAGNSSKDLILEIEKIEGTLGRPIRAELFGINLDNKLSEINLSELNKNFGVTIDYSIDNITDKRWHNKKVQILKFKVYPKITGKIIFPELKIENVNSKKKIIIVTKGTTSIPEISLSSSKAFERQQILVHVNITSSKSTSRLAISSKSSINNFESIPLKFERTKSKDGLYQLKIGWALSAIKSGLFKLQLPEIEYSESGVLRKKFYLPLIPINIKALPSYLPPTIPVGKVHIQSSIPDKLWLRSNSINYWNIKLTGNINDSYNLPPVLRQIKNNSNIKFLPVTTTRTIRATVDNLNSQVTHSIPFKALSSGFLTLPQIKLQYYDPDNNKVIILTNKPRTIFVLTLFLEIILYLIAFSIVVFVLNLLYINTKKIVFSKMKVNQAILVLQDNSVSCLRRAIKLLTESEFWPDNITIKQWGERWKEKYQVNNGFDDFIYGTSNSFYAESKNQQVKDLCVQLEQLINNKKRVKT